MALSAGTRLGPYEIFAPIGKGGMGEIYRARDPRLDRDVAIKVLPPDVSTDPDRLRRFDQEACATAALNHPNILAVYDLGAHDGQSYVVSELLVGQTLREALARGALPVEEVIDYGIQIVAGLAAAHAKGIAHRDLKPENLFITRDGHLKILDFGLAKVIKAALPGVSPTMAATGAAETALGTVSGTVGYMSPEQVRGLPVDHRTDLFSLGIVLFEMITGERPFKGSSSMGVADAILHEQPRSLGDMPAGLSSVIHTLLEKDPANRYGSAHDVLAGLKAAQVSLTPRPKRHLSRVTWISIAAVIALVVSVSTWLSLRSSRERWVRNTATPEIARLLDADDYARAAALAQEARAALPKDSTLERLWTRATAEVSITTTPPGAEISVRPYQADPNAWQTVGSTPLDRVRFAKDDFIWKVAKPGFAPIVFIGAPSLTLTWKLWPDHTVPADMVVVPSGQATLAWPFGLAEQAQVDDFLIDQHELTNDEYQKFVDVGGYQKREYWTEPFVKDGRTIPWEEGVTVFRDATGRPGPAAWQVGTFPKGSDNHPVNGISWYEAAAYARFAGKTLPTVYHWRRAAQTNKARLIDPGSNFLGSSTTAVGANSAALSGFGTTDMAGNVKEWCLNETTGGKRSILGGGFGESNYMFDFMDSASPWERRANYGVRFVKLSSPPSSIASGKLDRADRDMLKDPVVSDEVFAAFKGLYAYDHTDLHVRVEETETTAESIREKVTFDAAYGKERMIVHLFLPKNVAPPFQTVVYVPGAGALETDRFNTTTWFEGDRDFFVKSGRAALVPVLKGTWERRDDVKPGGPTGNPPGLWRDHIIMWSKDLSRSLDYLETRKDIDKARIAYFGFSFGGAIAPVLLAMEPRLKAAVLSSGGLHFVRALPEADGTNFVTRVRIPVLMLNGRYDSLFPVESSQLAIFQRLGTPDKDKRHLIFDSGHGALPHAEEVRETLDWLDKYLGQVRR
jgi:serine/threonine protein kinase/dienelactone hydrolase